MLWGYMHKELSMCVQFGFKCDAAPCQSDYECVNGVCSYNKLCGNYQPTVCIKGSLQYGCPGDRCKYDDSCFSGFCEEDRCCSSTSNTLRCEGDPCQTAGQCSGGFCVENQCSEKNCRTQSSNNRCPGDQCKIGTNCKSGYCNNYTCSMNPPTSCSSSSAKQKCLNDPCTLDNECYSKYCSVKGVCSTLQTDNNSTNNQTNLNNTTTSSSSSSTSNSDISLYALVGCIVGIFFIFVGIISYCCIKKGFCLKGRPIEINERVKRYLKSLEKWNKSQKATQAISHNQRELVNANLSTRVVGSHQRKISNGKLASSSRKPPQQSVGISYAPYQEIIDLSRKVSMDDISSHSSQFDISQGKIRKPSMYNQADTSSGSFHQPGHQRGSSQATQGTRPTQQTLSQFVTHPSRN
eukprot:403373448